MKRTGTMVTVRQHCRKCSKGCVGITKLYASGQISSWQHVTKLCCVDECDFVQSLPVLSLPIKVPLYSQLF